MTSSLAVRASVVISSCPPPIPVFIFHMVKSASAGEGDLIIDMKTRIEMSESVAAIFAKKILAALSD